MANIKRRQERCSDTGLIVNWEQPNKQTFESRSAEIHVWRIPWHDLETIGFLQFMTEKEKETALKYQLQEKKNRFIISRGVLKQLSARYLKTPHKSLNCVTNRFGKPFFANYHNHLQFNTSHSAGILLIAFGFSLPTLGIDIEQVKPAFDYSDIVDQFFTPAEKRSLLGKNPVKQFFKIWTRKEALAKATGRGLTDNLFAIDVTTEKLGQPYNYQLQTFETDVDFLFSIAGTYELKNIQCFDYLPAVI
jgi:4'-phosphopantetheinyl transferase